MRHGNDPSACSCFHCTGLKNDTDANKKRLASEFRHSPTVTTACDDDTRRESCIHTTAVLQANGASSVSSKSIKELSRNKWIPIVLKKCTFY